MTSSDIAEQREVACGHDNGSEWVETPYWISLKARIPSKYAQEMEFFRASLASLLETVPESVQVVVTLPC